MAFAGPRRRCSVTTLHRLIESLEPRQMLSTYYVSPSGSDGNAGTSMGAAWASVAKVDATIFQPGDQILFQRGGEWHGQLTASASGTSVAPIVYGDYGSGTKPTFDGSDVVPNSSFTLVTGTTYSFPVSAVGNANANAYWVYSNHTALLAATSLNSVESNPGSFFVSGSTVYVNAGSVAPSGSNVYTLGDRGAGTEANSSLINSNGFSYITFNNIIGRETAEVGSGGSLAGGISDGYVYRIQGGSNVTLTNVEGDYGSKHIIGAINTQNFLCSGSLFTGAPHGTSDNGLPYGNATAAVSFASDNNGNYVHQWINDTVNNYDGGQPAFLTHNDGTNSMKSILLQNFVSVGSPIALQPGTGVAITIKGGSITNNTLTAYTGTGTTETIDGLSVTGNYSFIQINGNATVQNCVVTNANQPAIQVTGPNNVIRFNTLSPYGYSSGIALDYNQNSTTATNEKIYGNLITGTSNAISAKTGDTYTADYDFFDSANGAPTFVTPSGTLSLAQYQSAGYETHAVTGNPQFTNAANNDFSLAATSPAVNVVPTSVVTPAVPTDIRGNARPNGGAYDAGAYETLLTNHPPTITTQAAANPNPVTGTTAALSVAATDPDGNNTLTYTWTATGTPPAVVTFSDNADNSASNTTATFTKAGTYTLEVAVYDGQTTLTSDVTVTVNKTLTKIVVTPASPLVAVNTTQQFAASVNDQFGNAISGDTATFSIGSGTGTISGAGLYTAPNMTGSAVVNATYGGVTGTASVTITPPNQAPTVATAASASPNPVTGSTTTLSVLGADDNGEANLNYTWSLTGTPPAGVSYSLNGTNAAKTTVATFTANGTYNFLVTIKDAGNLATTSTVTVTVNSLTPIAIDGKLDARYGQPIVVQSQATNYGNGNLGSPSAPYSQLSAAYAVIDESADRLYVFIAGSLNLNNAHLDLLIDSIPNSGSTVNGVSNLSTLANVAPYSSSFATIKFDSGFLPDHIFTSTYGAGTSQNYVNLDTGATAQFNTTDPAAGTITSSNNVPYFQESVNNAASSGIIAANSGGSVTTGIEYAFSLSGLGYTPANYSANAPIGIAAMISYGSHTESTNQILAPYTPAASELAKDGGIYTYYGNGNFDFSNNTRFAGNQFFTISPPVAGNQAPTIQTPASANPNPTTTTTTNLSVLGADDGGESNLTYSWSTVGTPPSPVSFSLNGTNAAKNTVASFTVGGTYNFLVTVSDGSLSTTSSVTVTVNPTPIVSAFTVNDGTAQRSMVNSLTVKFNEPVSLSAGAITLSQRSASGGSPTAINYKLTPSSDNSSYVLTFTNNASLADGIYDLVVNAGSATSTAGVSNTAAATYTFDRLFGDIDGNAVVNNLDNVKFNRAYGSVSGSAAYVAAFDYDGNGVINNLDNAQFNRRYGVSYSY